MQPAGGAGRRWLAAAGAGLPLAELLRLPLLEPVDAALGESLSLVLALAAMSASTLSWSTSCSETECTS